MYYSNPTLADLTPPVVPLVPDWNAVHFWASPDDVKFRWNTTSHPIWVRQASTAHLIDCPCEVSGCCVQVQVADNTPDPESSPVLSEWRIFLVGNNNGLTRVAGPVDVSNPPYHSRALPTPSLLATCYSLLTTHYSLLTTHYAPLTTHHSPLTTHYSPLTTHYSPLITHHSPPLTTHHSPRTTRPGG